MHSCKHPIRTPQSEFRNRMESLPVPVYRTPSAYERLALREIEIWKTPQQNWFTKTARRVNGTLRSVSDLVHQVPGVDWVVDNVFSNLLTLTNELTQDTVWKDAIYDDYRLAGHTTVFGPEDVFDLDLEAVDGCLDGLDTKYRVLAAAEGAATGYAGAAGLVPDIVALVALTLRAAGEYAAYCGFDIGDPRERLYALQLLSFATDPADAPTKSAALVPVMRTAHAIAKRQTSQVVEQLALGRAFRNALRALGIRLTQAKLAQALPVTGAVVGGSFNAYFSSKVCDTAFFLYRERFLLQKYGPEMLGQSGAL